METLETTIEERILIHENTNETGRTRADAEMRAKMLRKIQSYKQMANVDLNSLNSPPAISEFIFQEHLKVNRVLMQQHKSGLKNAQSLYELPSDLEQLKFDLLAWANLKPSSRGGRKYEFLMKEDEQWKIDDAALEKEFISRKLKFYIQGDDITEYKTLELIREYAEAKRCPNSQVALISFLNDRFESVGQFKFKIRWTYFDRDRH